MKTAAVIVAAGSGSRMGRPKQFLPLAGRPLIHWTVDAFLKLPEISDVVVVLSPEHLAAHGNDWTDPRVRAVKGGATRLDSVRLGVKAAGAADLLAVHDGARPLVTPELIRATLEAAREYGAAVPGVPVKDTLKEFVSDYVAATPDRARYWAAQTPQCYRGDVLRGALKKFAKTADATDESQLVEASGTKVRLVASTPANLKVTTPEDLVFAEALLRRVPSYRTGIGWDLHKLVAGRPLMLAGLKIPHTKGLLGHSDGDVILHAVADALLGAAGAGEIGEYFPPGEAKTKGIASSVILARVLVELERRGATLEHVDVAVVAEEPKLKPHYAAFKTNLAALLSVPEARVNVKAKTHEGLGEIGRGEAIACTTVATLRF